MNISAKIYSDEWYLEGYNMILFGIFTLLSIIAPLFACKIKKWFDPELDR